MEASYMEIDIGYTAKKHQIDLRLLI